MFIRLRIMAHDALARAIEERGIENISSNNLSIMINTMHKAGIDEGFANELDQACANAFDEQTAEEYEDLACVFEKPTDELKELLEGRGIIEREED